MPKKSFIKTLLERRIPQILGSYLVAGTSLILFIEYLIEKYQFPSYYSTLALFALIGILPSVVILAYFHGTPGKDEWTKVEKVGIPINVLFIAGILFFGDSLNIWKINKDDVNDNLPNIHLLYIGSPEEDHGACYKIAENILSNNEGADLFALSESELKNLRLNIESKLSSEYYNQNLITQVLIDNEKISFINNAIKEQNNLKERVKKIYDFFEKPTHIIFVWIYSIKSNNEEIIKYVADIFGGLGDGFNKRIRHKMMAESINVLESAIFDAIIYHVTAKENLDAQGEIVKVDGNYVYINSGGLILKKNMNLIGYTKWSHYDNNGDGFTDKDFSYYKWINDVKRALDYTKNSDNYTIEDINFYQQKYDWLTSDSLRSTAKGELWLDRFSYKLNVIDIRDTTIVAKLIDLANPWVEINVGDQVMLD